MADDQTTDPRVADAVRALLDIGMVIHSTSPRGTVYLRMPGRLGTLRVSDHAGKNTKARGVVAGLTVGTHIKPGIDSLRRHMENSLGRYMLVAPLDHSR